MYAYLYLEYKNEFVCGVVCGVGVCVCSLCGVELNNIMPQQITPSPMKDWKPIRCEKCERCENLEFATVCIAHECDIEDLSRIKCMICSNEDKKYAMNNLGVDYEDFWCIPYCSKCKSVNVALFIPNNKTIYTAPFAKCEACLSETK